MLAFLLSLVGITTTSMNVLWWRGPVHSYDKWDHSLEHCVGFSWISFLGLPKGEKTSTMNSTKRKQLLRLQLEFQLDFNQLQLEVAIQDQASLQPYLASSVCMLSFKKMAVKFKILKMFPQISTIYSTTVSHYIRYRGLSILTGLSTMLFSRITSEPGWCV